MITVTISLVIAYLLGSLSSAIIVCKVMNLPDPRSQGSKNPGATNVLRIGGKVPAMITLTGDALKGFLPVIAANLVGIHGFGLGCVAAAAVAGHVFPIFFNFKGGKGVATTLGALLALSLPIGLAVIATWVVVATVSRYSSLASLIAAILAPIYAAIFSDIGYFLPLAVIAAIITWRHLGNIERLKAGTESKINF